MAVLGAALPSGAAVTISLQATPDRAPADGSSLLTITAEVRENGKLVTSGYDVRFQTSAGALLNVGGEGVPGDTLLVAVQSGFARCLLRATTYATNVLVTAAVDQAGGRLDRVEVSFGAEAGPRTTQDQIVRVSGNYLAYAPAGGYQVMEIVGNGQVSYRGIVIRAAKIHIDLQDYLVIARDFRGATISTREPPYSKTDLADSSKPPYEGEKLIFDLRSMQGAIYSAYRGETVLFGGRTLSRMPDRQLAPGTFDLFDLRDVEFWIRAKRASIYPYEKIRFDHARFYLNDVKVMSLGVHFEPLGYQALSGPALSQVINYSTQDGWIIDLPYYFSVGDRHTNEFRLTRGVRSGLFGRDTGLQVSYGHHTDLKNDKGSFDFVIDQLGKKFGIQYQRQQRYDPYTYGTLSLQWPEHHNFFSNASLYMPAGPGNISMTANVDYLTGFGAGFSNNFNAVWQPRAVPLRSLESQLTASLGTSYSHSAGGGDFYRQSATLSVSRNPWRFMPGAALQPYAGVRFSNTWDGNKEAAFTFNTSWRQQVGQSQNLSLGYTFDTAWNSDYSVANRHLFTFNWNLYQQDAWNGYAFANYNLVDRSLSASLLLDYTFARDWGVEAQTVYQSSPAGSFGETEFWLYRVLGARELRLRYSLERGRLFFEVDNTY